MAGILVRSLLWPVYWWSGIPFSAVAVIPVSSVTGILVRSLLWPAVFWSGIPFSAVAGTAAGTISVSPTMAGILVLWPREY